MQKMNWLGVVFTKVKVVATHLCETLAPKERKRSSRLARKRERQYIAMCNTRQREMGGNPTSCLIESGME